MAAKYARTCDICQTHKAPAGKMHATHVDQQWQMISTDLIGPLPRSAAGHTWLLVMQDRLTKWIKLRPLKKATGKPVTEAVRTQICILHGCPDVIVTDSGQQFTSNELREFLSALHIKYRPTPTYTPQCNPVERANRVIKTMMEKNVTKNQKTWDKYLLELAFAYNTAQHESTGHTPAHLNLGRKLKSPESVA